MKSYPHIESWKRGPLGEPMYAFEKLDGSNIRFEWSKKRGWYKFGSRNQLIDQTTPVLGLAIPLFLNKYGESLDKIFREEKQYRNCDKFIVFCEYYGPRSFAGYHYEDDINSGKMNVILFDVNQHKRGLIPPQEFIENFRHVGIPKIIGNSNLNQEFVRMIQLQEIDVWEGVVCKGIGQRFTPWMAKIKTFAWLWKLKNSNMLSDEEKESLSE